LVIDDPFSEKITVKKNSEVQLQMNKFLKKSGLGIFAIAPPIPKVYEFLETSKFPSHR
jgi:hypothetical protein